MSRFVRAVGFGWVVMLLGLVPPVSAQVVEMPPGSVRGIFGGGSAAPGAPDLTMTFDLNGGYDDNTIPGGSDSPGQAFAPIESGYVTSAGAALRYQKGMADRFVLGSGSGSINQQQIASGSQSFRLIRGEGSFQAGTGIGRRGGVTMGVGASYEPTYLFGAFSSLGRADVPNPVEDIPLPTEDPSLSLTQQRWLSSRASGGAFYDVTSRQRLSARYDGSWLRPIGESTGFESTTNSVTVFHTWDPTPTRGFDLSYRFDDNPQVFEEAELTLQTQTAEGRLRYGRRLSPSRSVSLMAGGGVVRVDAGGFAEGDGFDLVAPTLSGSARFDFTPTWGVSLTARRDITVLNGFSPEPFESNAALLSLDGTVARRLWIAVSTGYTRGEARIAPDGGFTLKLLNAQVRYGFGAHVGLLVRYTYNEHEFQDVAVVPTSFPLRYSRNSIRVGLTMWLPLFGTF